MPKHKRRDADSSDDEFEAMNGDVPLIRRRRDADSSDEELFAVQPVVKQPNKSTPNGKKKVQVQPVQKVPTVETIDKLSHELMLCNGCSKTLPIERFGFRMLMGNMIRKLNCPDCCTKSALKKKKNLKKRKDSLESHGSDSSESLICKRCNKPCDQQDFGFKRMNGQLVRKLTCESCCSKSCDVSKRYRNTEKGSVKAAENAKRRNGSEAGKRSMKLYQKTSKYKEAVKRYEETDKHKEKQKRANDKIAVNPGKRLMKSICNRISDSLAGRRDYFSSKLSSYTDFKDLNDIIAHFQSSFNETMTLQNYGVAWEIDHIIARKWYNHDDEEDIKRCWSKANLQPLSPKDNNSKRISIPKDELLYTVGVDKWPKSWNGIIPDTQTKEAWYKHHHDVRMKRIAAANSSNLEELEDEYDDSDSDDEYDDESDDEEDME